MWPMWPLAHERMALACEHEVQLIVVCGKGDRKKERLAWEEL